MRPASASKPVTLAVMLAFALTACQAPAPAPEAAPSPPPVAPAPPPPEPPPPPRVPTAAERALQQGVALYDAGDFNGAIRLLLAAKPIWDDPGAAGLATKLAAHKYVAFSYCVTNRRAQCRQQFVDALKLDPGFGLEPAEKTHPIWGAEFERAKAQAASSAGVPRRTPAATPGATPPKGP